MSRRTGMVCAAALLLAAAGCSAASFWLSLGNSASKPQIVSGSVDQVSANLKAALNNVGILVSASPIGEDVRMIGETKLHKRFILVLKRRATSSGENTVIHVEWEKDADEQFWLTVLELLASPTSLGAPSTNASGPIG